MKRNDVKQQIEEYFFQNPTSKLRVREIERKLDLSLPSVIRYVKDLVEEKILKILKIGDVVFYQANRSSNNYLFAKRQFNLKIISSSGIIDYIRKNYSNPTIVLFGSYYLGEDIESSDIDIFIETSLKNVEIPKSFEEKLGRKIQIFNYSSIEKIGNKELANNIINGITLNGFLEVL